MRSRTIIRKQIREIPHAKITIHVRVKAMRRTASNNTYYSYEQLNVHFKYNVRHRVFELITQQLQNRNSV